jgi:hypothetical protein
MERSHHLVVLTSMSCLCLGVTQTFARTRVYRHLQHGQRLTRRENLRIKTQRRRTRQSEGQIYHSTCRDVSLAFVESQ